MRSFYSRLLFLSFSIFSFNIVGQTPIIVGAMKNVMWKGELQGKIHLDTLSNKKHLYGLGPVEFLRGEILIMDGKSFQSSVISDKEMKVEEGFDIKAPFFGYAVIPEWEEHMLPDSVQTLLQIEKHIYQLQKFSRKPFLFKLEGKVENAIIHVVNLAPETQVRSPQEAHKGQVSYVIKDEEVTMLGFFSTDHQSIFTHHDTYIHIHLITSDEKKMGHLDQVTLKKGNIKFFLPKE